MTKFCPVSFSGTLLGICFLFAPLAAHASEPQRHQISWKNFAQVFSESFQTLSPEHSLGEAREFRRLKNQSLRFNPNVQGGWQPDSYQLSASQSFPWGLSLEGTYSQSSNPNGPQGSESYEAKVSQQLLRGGLWHGWAPVSSQTLTEEIEELQLEQEFQILARDALFAFIDAQVRVLQTELAKRDLERSEKEAVLMEKDVAQGYRAKSDLLVVQLARNGAILVVQVAENSERQSLRTLSAKLWRQTADGMVSVDTGQPPSAFMSRLEAAAWPSETPAVALARKQKELVEASAAVASRDSLPAIGLWHSWKQTQNTADLSSVGDNIDSTSWRHSYGIEFSMALASVVTREDARAAALDSQAAQAKLLQAVVFEKQQQAAAHEDVATLRKRIELSALNVDLASRAQDFEGQKYRDGRSTIQEFRRSQKVLADAENELVQARADLLKRLIEQACDTGTLRSVLEVGS